MARSGRENIGVPLPREPELRQPRQRRLLERRIATNQPPAIAIERREPGVRVDAHAAVVEAHGRLEERVGMPARGGPHADERARRVCGNLELQLLRQIGRIHAGSRQHVHELTGRVRRNDDRTRSPELREPGERAAGRQTRDPSGVKDVAVEHHPRLANRQALLATDERAVDRKRLVA